VRRFSVATESNHENIMNGENNHYRYERKFVITGAAKSEIETQIKLHPAMFSEIFCERQVNNIYFDTSLMQYYFATVNGLRHRMKCRIRWYGQLFGQIEKPVLELKIKDGFVGRKEAYPLAPFSLDEHFHLDIIKAVFELSKLPGRLATELLTLQPTLVNCYRRKYFQSADRTYRVTLDTNLRYYRISPYKNTFLQKSVDEHTIVVELKYNHDKDRYADSISGLFPFRMTRSSKYVNGIQRLFLGRTV